MLLYKNLTANKFLTNFFLTAELIDVIISNVSYNLCGTFTLGTMVEFKINKTDFSGRSEYGIDLIIDSKTIKSISSLSESLDDVTELVNVCNDLGIEPCHFDDIVDDYLTDYQIR